MTLLGLFLDLYPLALPTSLVTGAVLLTYALSKETHT